MEFTEMELQKQGIIISDVFPEEADVLYNFTERVFEDVISEYCSQLFELCSMRDKLLYLKSVPTAYRYLEHLENTLIDMEPINVPRYRIEKLLARVFAPWLERYLKQELDWVQKSCKDQIDKYERQVTTVVTVLLCMTYYVYKNVLRLTYNSPLVCYYLARQQKHGA